MWQAILVVLPFFAGTAFGDVCNLTADAAAGKGPNSWPLTTHYNLDCCRMQTVSVETTLGESGRLALSALCPKTYTAPNSQYYTNSHVFSTLYLDHCFAFDENKTQLYDFNENDTDPIHGAADNITTACKFDKNSLSKTGDTWADGLRLVGTCNGHDVNYTIGKSQVNPRREPIPVRLLINNTIREGQDLYLCPGSRMRQLHVIDCRRLFWSLREIRL
jgi:hypothetical protein